jgi:hypothetical protein
MKLRDRDAQHRDNGQADEQRPPELAKHAHRSRRPCMRRCSLPSFSAAMNSGQSGMKKNGTSMRAPSPIPKRKNARGVCSERMIPSLNFHQPSTV